MGYSPHGSYEEMGGWLMLPFFVFYVLSYAVDEKYSLGGMGVALLAMGGLLGWVIHLMVAMKKWGDG